MNKSILDSPYFNQKKEFTTYEEPVEYSDAPVERAPGGEPEKGFTSIVIPACFRDYSLFHYTGHCIGSVHEHTDPDKTPYEIILVVNGKTGIGLSNPQESQCDKVIELEKNLGYGGGMNRGIRVARGEYVVLLSNDVLVFDHWLEDFQEALQYRKLVMATPQYGEPYARAREANIKRQKWMEKTVEESFSDFRDFSCIATRKSLFNEIGLFDEKFFAYKEDLDMMNRMDKEGLKYASSRRINTYHTIGATSVNMTPVDLKKDEGAKYYEEKWGK